ncbi:unnamed protein product [Linum trigynum]|uniref:Uncharacterized protein n=1 Tax=Linum trigynum TaxID=586398 RepID=A0AAV2EU26_9ROSI
MLSSRPRFTVVNSSLASKRTASLTQVHEQQLQFTVIVTVNSPRVSNLRFGPGRLGVHRQEILFTILVDREHPRETVNCQFFTSSPGFRSF